MANAGQFPRKSYSIEDRGFSTPCWVWSVSQHGNGYGLVRRDGRLQPAHRWHYEQAKGPIPAGLHLDHLCRVRCCVNPDHLEPVTSGENARRGDLATLTPAQVKEIRSTIAAVMVARPLTTKGTPRQRMPMGLAVELGMKYGVHKQAIINIWGGRTWVDGCRSKRAA